MKNTEKAIEWWNSLGNLYKRKLTTEHFVGRRVNTLCDSEIEVIYNDFNNFDLPEDCTSFNDIMYDYNKTIKMKKYNINNYIIIYPNESGWRKIIELTQSHYELTQEKANDWVNIRKENGGFKEQLWVLISIYYEMFFNGEKYFNTAIIDLCG